MITSKLPPFTLTAKGVALSKELACTKMVLFLSVRKGSVISFELPPFTLTAKGPALSEELARTKMKMSPGKRASQFNVLQKRWCARPSGTIVGKLEIDSALETCGRPVHTLNGARRPHRRHYDIDKSVLLRENVSQVHRDGWNDSPRSSRVSPRTMCPWRR